MKPRKALLAAALGAGLVFSAGCSTADEPMEGNVIHTIPLTTQGGRTTIPVSVNGADPATFLLDTGGSNGVLLRSFVEEEGLPLGEQRELRSPVGDNVVMVDTAEFNTLSYAGFEVPGGSSIIMEDAQFPVPGVRGLVSLNPLREHIIEFDLGGSELRIVSEPGRDVTAWQPHPAGAPFLGLDISVGDVVMPAHIDSGNPSVITLPLAYAEQLPLAGELQEVGRMRTVDAERVVYQAELTAPIMVGGITYAPEFVRFADLPFANIGVDALMNWVLVIDGPNERFGLYERN